MDNMKTINIKTLYDKYKVLVINFVIYACIYGNWIINKHYACDTYAVYYEGMTNVNLTNGRIVHWLIYSILEMFHFPVWKNLYFTQTVLYITISYLAYKIFLIFSKKSEKRTIDLLAIEVFSILLFGNISYAEGWFYFPETCFGSAISTAITFAAFFFFVKYCEFEKIIDLLISFILLNLSLNMYQVYIEVYISLCLLYIICNQQQIVKTKILRTFQIIFVGGIASFNSVAILKILQIIGIIPQTSRTSGLSIDIIINNIKNIFETQKIIWHDFNGHLSVFDMKVLAVMCIIASANLIIGQKNIADKVLVVVQMLMIYASSFAPLLVITSFGITPRYIYGFFISTIGIVIASIISSNNGKLKTMLTILLFVFMIGSYISIQNMMIDNFAINKIDQEQYNTIQQVIDSYEKENEIEVKYLAVGDDKSKKYGYESIKYTINDINVRAMAVSWSCVSALNYYTGRNYIKIDMSEEQKNQIFKNVDYNYFDVEKQLVINGDTAYLLIY